MSINDKGAYSTELQCRWRAWRVAVEPDILEVDLPRYNCTDMTGVIKTAQALMPAVVEVRVYVGGVLDIVYLRGAQGWQPREVRHARRAQS